MLRCPTFGVSSDGMFSLESFWILFVPFQPTKAIYIYT
jgi:hypothetical protein